MKSFFSVVVVLISPWVVAQGEVRQFDDSAPRLALNSDEVNTSHVFEAFLALAPLYCSEMAMVDITKMLLGRQRGLVSYDDVSNKVTVVADGAQYFGFELSVEIDPLFGMVAVVKGEVFIDGEGASELVNQRLLRIEGGWIDLKKAWENQVSTSTYDVSFGENDYVYQIHWVKGNAAVFGYGYPAGFPKKRFPIRGLNRKQGELTLWLKNDYLQLNKTTVKGSVVWRRMAAYQGQKTVTLKKK